MLRAYNRLLDRRPLVVKAVTGGSLAFTGDATAQYMEARAMSFGARSNSWYDQRRALALVSLGTVYQGPVNHFLLNGLERLFPAAIGWRSVMHKTLVTQLFANPCCYLPTFFVWTGSVRGLTLEQLESKVRHEYWPTLCATWAIFTPSNVLNYWLVPVRHQASSIALVGFLYQVSLSLLAGGGRGESEDGTRDGAPLVRRLPEQRYLAPGVEQMSPQQQQQSDDSAAEPEDIDLNALQISVCPVKPGAH
jgi:hypothetical protein